MPQINFAQYAPTRTPRWRFERVMKLTSRRPDNTVGRATARDDRYVRALKHYHLQYNSADATDTAREQLRYDNPGLAYAYEIFSRRDEPNCQVATMVEARILARMSDEEIAAAVAAFPDAIHWYEALFFNVRDRLDAHDWILNFVLRPAARGDSIKQGGDEVPVIVDQFLDSTLLFFAYYGGRHVVELAAGGLRPGSPASGSEDVAGFFDRAVADKLRAKSAMIMTKLPINRYNAMEMLTGYMALRNLEMSSQSEDAKRDGIQRAIAAMMEQINWAVGDAGAASVSGTAIEKYDNASAELRSSELQQLAAGTSVATIEGVELLKLPPPRKQESADGNPNAQQGS